MALAGALVGLDPLGLVCETGPPLSLSMVVMTGKRSHSHHFYFSALMKITYMEQDLAKIFSSPAAFDLPSSSQPV